MGKTRMPNSNMKISQRAIDYIKRKEDWRDRAYRDSKGVPTIGWGHTKGVKMGDRINRTQGEDFLKEDIAGTEAAMRNRIKTPLNQNQWDGAGIFAFNAGGLRNSDGTPTGFLKKLNAGKIDEAFKEELPRWVHVTMPNGKKRVLPGLVTRRGEEVAIGTTPMGKSIPHIPEYAEMDDTQGGNGQNAPIAPPQ